MRNSQSDTPSEARGRNVNPYRRLATTHGLNLRDMVMVEYRSSLLNTQTGIGGFHMAKTLRNIVKRTHNKAIHIQHVHQPINTKPEK